MELISAEAGPFGPRITGTTGRWLGTLQWALAHSSFLAAGAHRVLDLPDLQVPAGSWALLADESLVPLGNVRPDQVKSVQATTWEGYDFWCWMPRRDSYVEAPDLDDVPAGETVIHERVVTLDFLAGAVAELQIIEDGFTRTIEVSSSGITGATTLELLYDDPEGLLPASDCVLAWTDDGRFTASTGVWGYEATGITVSSVKVNGQPVTPVTGLAVDHRLRAYLANPGVLQWGSARVHDEGLDVDGAVQCETLLIGGANITELVAELRALPSQLQAVRAELGEVRERLIRLEAAT